MADAMEQQCMPCATPEAAEEGDLFACPTCGRFLSFVKVTEWTPTETVAGEPVRFRKGPTQLAWVIR